MEEKLAEAVRTYPCLWDVTSRSFKDSKAKENSWKSVASEVMLCWVDIKFLFLFNNIDLTRGSFGGNKESKLINNRYKYIETEQKQQ